MDPGTVPIKEFFIEEAPKRFQVHRRGEVFEAPPVLGPAQLLELVDVLKKMQGIVNSGDPGGAIEAIGNVFTGILSDETGPKFVELLSDRKRPIDLKRQLIPILQWLMEEYGMRPTQPSSASSSTSTTDNAGTPSTAGAPAEASTPAGWPRDGSST